MSENPKKQESIFNINPMGMFAGVTMPFPFMQPAMGQFIPMGMVPSFFPLNNPVMQQYMESAAASSLTPAVRPVFGAANFGTPSTCIDYMSETLRTESVVVSPKDSLAIATPSRNQSEIASHSKNEKEGPGYANQETIHKKLSFKTSSDEGKTEVPLFRLPASAFLLPFGGFAGFLPYFSYFKPMVNSDVKAYGEIPCQAELNSQHKKEREDVKESSDTLKIDGGSAEMDVAQILVNDMPVPVLSYTANSTENEKTGSRRGSKQEDDVIYEGRNEHINFDGSGVPDTIIAKGKSTKEQSNYLNMEGSAGVQLSSRTKEMPPTHHSCQVQKNTETDTESICNNSCTVVTSSVDPQREITRLEKYDNYIEKPECEEEYMPQSHPEVSEDRLLQILQKQPIASGKSSVVLSFVHSQQSNISQHKQGSTNQGSAKIWHEIAPAVSVLEQRSKRTLPLQESVSLHVQQGNNSRSPGNDSNSRHVLTQMKNINNLELEDNKIIKTQEEIILQQTLVGREMDPSKSSQNQDNDSVQCVQQLLRNEENNKQNALTIMKTFQTDSRQQDNGTTLPIEITKTKEPQMQQVAHRRDKPSGDDSMREQIMQEVFPSVVQSMLLIKEEEYVESVKDDKELQEEDDQQGTEDADSKMAYKCEVCSQLFRSPLGLQKHLEFHTDDGQHYTCTICFLRFCNAAALEEHIATHMRKRPHKCSYCPKAFRDPGSLQKHVRVHTGEKPYKCTSCYRSFAEYSSLRKHQRVHTGEQPYKCQYCSKAFSISGNLQRHILIHTGERPYRCSFCTKAFNNPSHLRRHVKNLHFKGDAMIDNVMLSHYGNHSGTSPKPLGADLGEGSDDENMNCETFVEDVVESKDEMCDINLEFIHEEIVAAI